MSNIKEYIKKLVQEIINEQDLDEESTSANAGGYSNKFFVSKNKKGSSPALDASEHEGWKQSKGMPKRSKVYDYKELWKGKKSAMNETISQLIKKELLNEQTYNKFKSDVKYRTKNEMLHKGIKEVKRKLNEVDRIVEYVSRMKGELMEGEEGVKYWKTTEKYVGQIAETLNKLNNKIKNLNQ